MALSTATEVPIAAIVTDIEGTTSSLAVLRDLLAPYARRELAAFVRMHAARPDVRRELDATRALADELGADEAQTIAILERWVDEDRKAPPLKTLQGLIWERGYRDGTLRAHLYADVLPALVNLGARGYPIYVYSSGSVLAQALFFEHSELGDIRGLFDGFFDTQVGAKNDRQSYLAIARSIGVDPRAVLFLTDARAELEAASAAGMRVLGVVREQSASLAPFAMIESFVEIDLPQRPVEPVDLAQRSAALCAFAKHCYQHGWAYATSGNFSLRLDRARIAITGSGLDKGELLASDVVQVDLLGRVVAGTRKPSAETPLHCALYRRDRRIGAVAHTHSLAATMLSKRARDGVITFDDYEMAKALPGVADHQTPIRLPVVPNSQDMSVLQAAVDRALSRMPDAPGYLVAGHGLTTWGEDLPSLKRHVEALEFLLACAWSEGSHA